MPESPQWRAALDAHDLDLRRRAVAAKTRTAYAIDATQFARWATERGLTPEAIDVRALRRYVASLTERGQAPSTVARKLAALRGLFRTQIELGARNENPAELLHSPKRPQRLPRVLKASEVAVLLDRIPATTPLELRDRAMFELAYASGLRAEELVSLDVESVDFDSERVRVEGKGGKTRLVPAGEHALAALERYLVKGRPILITDGTRALFISKSGRRLGTSDVRRRLRAWARAAAAQEPGTQRRPSARAAPLVRDPSARGRRRSAGDSGAAWPLKHLDDAGLHSGRVGTPSVRIRAGSPARVSV